VTRLAATDNFRGNFVVHFHARRAFDPEHGGMRRERGEVTRAVSGITIAGNLRPMLASLTAAGDLEHRQGVNVPTLRVDGMTVAGG